jgi:peptide/nickel transport system ATP-binding protein
MLALPAFHAMKLSLVSSPVLNSRLSIMPLLQVQDLKIHFPVRGGWFGRATDVIKAVDKVSFDVEEGSTVGLVGESGSGKSTVARALLKLTPVTGGTVTYQGREILHAGE